MMKALAFATLAWAANAASIHKLFARQMSPLMDLLDQSKVRESQVISKIRLEPQYQKDAIREKLIYGPFPMKAANDSHVTEGIQFKLDHNSDIIRTKLTGLCKDCMVFWVQADIGDQSGKKLALDSGIYSHHILGADFGRKMIAQPISSTCPDGKRGGFNFDVIGMKGKGGSGGMGMSHGAPASSRRTKRQAPDLGKLIGSLLPTFSVFIAQGDENSPMNYFGMNRIKSGFFLGKDEKISIMSEVINYKKTSQDVYLTLEYEYLPSPVDRKETYDVGIGAINVNPCGSQTLHPPTDKAMRYASPPWSVSGEAYLLDIKPHLHDGGINATVYVNGRAACSSKAVYGGDGGLVTSDGQQWETITAYTPCTEPVKISKGDNLTMEAYYDLTQHRLRPQANDHMESAEAMALALFSVAIPHEA